MLLANGLVRLDPYEPADFSVVHGWEVSVETAPRWRYGPGTAAPAAAAASAWAGVLDQRVIRCTDCSDVEPLGLVVAYDADLRNGRACFAIVMRPDRRSSRYGFSGLGLFVEHLFAQWNLRHLIAEVHEYNYPQFASGEGLVFERVGELRHHTLFNDRYWDLIYLRVTRDSWNRGLGRLVRARQQAFSS